MPTARRSTVKPGSENAADEAVAQPPMRPQSFMFIDFQEPGKVLKPDKAVRSFVMHQARRHRPWSTRKNPPSPDTESAPKRRRKDTPVQDTDESAEPSPVSSSFILERNPSESVSGPKSQSIGTSPASQPCTSRSPILATAARCRLATTTAAVRLCVQRGVIYGNQPKVSPIHSMLWRCEQTQKQVP